MEEENREQPTMEPANVINITEEERAVSEVGSQGQYGKFKSADKLLEAYNNLQSEFTKKCQLLSQLQKDKMEQVSIENQPQPSQEQLQKEQDQPEQTEQSFQSGLESFLLANDDAKQFEDEIKQKIDLSSTAADPYQVAWAGVILDHLTGSKQKAGDPIVNKYVLSDEQVRNQVIQEYLNDLEKHKPPYVISSQGGERVSSVSPGTPSSLAEAKEIVSKMFN